MPTVKAALEKELQTMADAGWTAGDIAIHFECSPATVLRYAKELGIKLTKEKSHGQLNLRKLLEATFPGYLIQEEFGIGERLRLDFFLPELNLAIEYDGIQHSKPTSYFHADMEDFLDAKVRDQRKEELCAIQGIKLVRIDKNNGLDSDKLLKLASESLDNTNGDGNGECNRRIVEPRTRNGRKSILSDPRYKEIKRQQARDNYRRQKEWLRNAQARNTTQSN